MVLVRAPGTLGRQMTDPFPFVLALPAAVIAAIYFLRSIRQVNQWEVGARFTLGKLSGQRRARAHASSSRASSGWCASTRASATATCRTSR